ncbi:MAG: mandelate racemase [Chloroflexi bacterium]|nr:mandelate racemase [Chloroflexota bacterium]
MKITDVKIQCFTVPMMPWRVATYGPTQEVTLITITTDEGIEGYATARAQAGTSGRVFGEYLTGWVKRAIVGKDPMAREEIWQALWLQVSRLNLPIFALSCTDVALWDIAGKALQTPVYQLLGHCRTKMRAYASSAHMHRPEEYVEDAVAMKAAGYTAYKLHGPATADGDVACCRAVRKAVGDDFVLMTDPVGHYNHREALWVGEVMEELGFYWYEEPLPDYDVGGYIELCRMLKIPVLAGEVTSGGLFDAADWVSRGAVDALRADVYWKGGITGVMKMARLCEAFGINIEIHHAATPLMNWANLACECAIANTDFFEVMVPLSAFDYGLQQYANIDKEGFVHVSDRPGTGADLDWDYINAHTTYKV